VAAECHSVVSVVCVGTAPPPSPAAAPLGLRSVQSVFLDTQYRMTGVINDWASAATYAGQLVAAPAVRRRTLRDRPPPLPAQSP